MLVLYTYNIFSVWSHFTRYIRLYNLYYRELKRVSYILFRMYMCSEKYIPQHEHNIGKIDDQKVRVQLLVYRIYIYTYTIRYGGGGEMGMAINKIEARHMPATKIARTFL